MVDDATKWFQVPVPSQEMNQHQNVWTAAKPWIWRFGTQKDPLKNSSWMELDRNQHEQKQQTYKNSSEKMKQKWKDMDGMLIFNGRKELNVFGVPRLGSLPLALDDVPG